MAVLVTGGAGYIGSHTIRALVRSGRTPVVYDNLSCGHRDAVRDVRFVAGELADFDHLKEVMVQQGVESVIHFAAFIQVGESMSDPQKYYRNNVGGTLTLLRAMREAGVRPIVFSSSAAVYGNPDTVPIPETAHLRPTSVYGRTKLIMENVLSDYAEAYPMSFTALRYFNVAGADPEGDIGEDHDPETHIIPLLLKAAMGQRASFTLFGTDYPTEDGTCVRDYIHVADLADAHLLALDKLERTGESKIYNLGNGSGFSNRQVIDAVQRVTGRRIDVREEGRRQGDPASLVAGSERATQELGWRPRYTELEEIIRTAWRWHTAHPTGFNR